MLESLVVPSSKLSSNSSSTEYSKLSVAERSGKLAGHSCTSPKAEQGKK